MGEQRAGVDEHEASSSAAACSAAEAWTPEWATPALQTATLLELDELRVAGVMSVEEASLAELRRAAMRGKLLAEGPGVCCEVIEKGSGLLAEFIVPLFYPVVPLGISFRWQEQPAAAASGDTRRVSLAALESMLRDEVVRPNTGVPHLRLAAEWVREQAPERIKALRAEQVAAAAADRKRAAAAAPADPPPVPAPKESASSQRKTEKFSPNWDLCSGFVKHGKCKTKNCKWRHEMPVKAEKKSEPAATAGAPVPAAAKQAAAAGEKKKKR